MEYKVIAKMFGVTAERVRQLKESALKKLKIKYKKQIETLLR